MMSLCSGVIEIANGLVEVNEVDRTNFLTTRCSQVGIEWASLPLILLGKSLNALNTFDSSHTYMRGYYSSDTKVSQGLQMIVPFASIWGIGIPHMAHI
jgi:hypothetical protein